MSRFVKQSTKKAGTAPGTLIHVGDRKMDHSRIFLMDYDQDHLTEQELESIEASFPFKDAPTVTWINIIGLHDIGLLEKIGHHFGIHPLVLEDIVHTGQRPKFEDFEDYLYTVFKMLTYDSQTGHVRSEQVSLIIGNHFVISYQEAEGDSFDPVRERIRKGKGRIRKSGCGYLTYALIDSIVDHYYDILEILGDKIETLEKMLIEEPKTIILEEIHTLKREMIFFRKQVWPVREMLNGLIKSESPILHESTTIYFSDVHDHVIQLMDIIESLKEVLSSMLDLYLSTVSNRMNDVMRVLTIIATIFIPLTFLAGIYGMNFEYMPELKWRGGYFALLAVMIAAGATMIFFFRKKKWL